MIQQMLAYWSLVPLTFLNSAWTIWKFSVHIMLKPSLKNFQHYFASMWDEFNCAHLSCHSRMSGSRWVITSSWLSGSWRVCFFFFLYSSSVYSTTSSLYLLHLFGPFQLFIVLIFSCNVPLASLIFLKRSLVFPFLLFSSISLHWSLRKALLSLLVILWNSAFKWV